MYRFIFIATVLAAGCITNPPGSNNENGSTNAKAWDTGTDEDATDQPDVGHDSGDPTSDTGVQDMAPGCPETLPAIMSGGVADEVAVDRELGETASFRQTRCSAGVAVGLRLLASDDDEFQVAHEIGLGCGSPELECVEGVMHIRRRVEGQTSLIGEAPGAADPDLHEHLCPADMFLVGIDFTGTVTSEQDNEIVRTMTAVCDGLVVDGGEVFHAGKPESGPILNQMACATLAEQTEYECTAPIPHRCADGMVVHGVQIYSQFAIEQPKILCVPITLDG